MTNDEIIDLLTAVSAYDNRKPNPASVLAWGKASELGRWTLAEALDAVHAHFSENPDYLMPAHITARVKASRQDRAMRNEALALDAAPVDPVAAARVQEIVGSVAKNLSWDMDRASGPTGLGVRCPYCGAAQGVRCVATSTGKPLSKSGAHPSRLEALDELRGTA